MAASITGPTDTIRPMWEMSLGEFLDGVVRRNPDKVFLEIAGQSTPTMTFTEG